MVLFSIGQWVWLPHAEDAFIPVQMVKQLGDKILAKAQTGEVRKTRQTRLGVRRNGAGRKGNAIDRKKHARDYSHQHQSEHIAMQFHSLCSPLSLSVLCSNMSWI